MTKKILVVLLIVTLTLGVLAGCNKREVDKQTHDMFLEVLPEAKNFSKLDTSNKNIPSTVEEAYYDTNGAGFVIKVVTKGFNDGLTIIVGIDNNGVITGAKCIESNESWKIEQTLGYEFIGRDINNYVDVEAGATSLTVNGYRNGIGDALKAYDIIKNSVNPGHNHGNGGNIFDDIFGGNEDGLIVLNDYTLGMGVVVSLENSRIGYAQIDATVATVVLDENGKIVDCKIDAAYNKVDISDGYVTVPGEFKTKKELGYDYNMSNFGVDNNGDGRVLEWFEQARVFEQFVIGKTASEVEKLGRREHLQEVNGHIISTDQTLLNAGCTIQIGDFVNAVVKACNDDQKMTFKSKGNFTLGLGINSYDNGSADAEYDGTGLVMVYSDMAAVVMEDNKILAALNDAIQPQIGFDIEGEITTKTFNGTKRELKENYGMVSLAGKLGLDNNGDGKVVEWYLQSAAFSAYVVGMTPAEVDKMPITINDRGYQISGDYDLLNAGCTIQITDIRDVVVEAAENAY